MTRARILVRRVHLWLGILLGGLFALLGLTGSALVFYVGIDAVLHPPARSVAAEAGPGWTSPVWDTAVTTARASPHGAMGSWSFEVTGEGGAIPARHYGAAGSHHSHHESREMVWFSPDGTRIVRSQPWGGYLMSWLYELHMHLLAGETGRQVVGWSGVATLVLLASGIVAWWPRGSWRKALAFKRDAVAIRRLRDLHKLGGVGSAGLLIVLVATGVLLALPEVKGAVFGPEPSVDVLSATAEGRQIPVATALAAAHRTLPGGTLAFIDVPPLGADPFRIRVQVPGDPHRRFPSSFVYVDQHRGTVLAVRDARTGPPGSRLATWIRTLHDGSVGGLPVRILAVLIGLTPAALFATGLLHWQRRRRAARPLPAPPARPLIGKLS